MKSRESHSGQDFSVRENTRYKIAEEVQRPRKASEVEENSRLSHKLLASVLSDEFNDFRRAEVKSILRENLVLCFKEKHRSPLRPLPTSKS